MIVWRHWCGAINTYAPEESYRSEWEAPLFCSGCRFEIKRHDIEADCEFFTMTPAEMPAELAE